MSLNYFKEYLVVHEEGDVRDIYFVNQRSNIWMSIRQYERLLEEFFGRKLDKFEMTTNHIGEPILQYQCGNSAYTHGLSDRNTTSLRIDIHRFAEEKYGRSRHDEKDLSFQ